MMIKPRQTSVVILITLAELAWLAAFGLLFAYRSKVGELVAVRQNMTNATSELTFWRTNAPDTAKLFDERAAINAEKTNLQLRLAMFENYLEGRSPEDVARVLAEAKAATENVKLIEERANQMALKLSACEKLKADVELQLQSTINTLADLQRKWEELPPNPSGLAKELHNASNELATLRGSLSVAGSQLFSLSNTITQLQSGEVAIRRELIGLPTNELHRVIFIMDTSSSMRSSPAWIEARTLMRTWVEYLSVEECVLVQFNDKATAFPQENYLRIRESNGRHIPESKAQLLAEFDHGHGGIYSDLLEALKLAYKRPKPDLIVLFTDGHPHIASRMDSSYASNILREATLRPQIPILAVAVGSYEIEGVGGPRESRNAAIAFLKDLSKRTGGNFIGK